MNTKKIKTTQIIVTIFCLIAGTLLHFSYQWSGNNNIVASFSAVNESVWEHLKLAFFPMLLSSILVWPFLHKKANNYIEAQMIGIFTAIAFITTIFYTYSGIIGTNLFFIDIALFVFAVILGEWITYKIMLKEKQSSIVSKILAFFILIILTLSFIFFTYYTPKANFFKDPIGDFYGIPKAEKSIA